MNMTPLQLIKNEYPNLPLQLSGLNDLSNNLWWSWHPAARMLFKKLNRQAWKESSHNPVLMLRQVPREVFDSAVQDPQYMRHYNSVLAQFQKDLDPKEGWLSENIMNPNHFPIAYFSAEYGLHHSLPFYAGGLGFLAGDFLKECSDLKVPLVAVGFMYPGGYVHQHIREDGWQEDFGRLLDREAASISKVLDNDGKPIVVKVPLIEPPIYVTVWKIEVGRIPLYLMDTDIENNDLSNRKISEYLYIGDVEQRLRQEIVLGIGGSQVLEALGITHSVLHLNEGHAAFALVERIRERLQRGMNHEKAFEEVLNTSVFTTHTSVPAGHDVFPFELMEKYFHAYWPALGLDRESFFRLGIHPDWPSSGFNMTAFALRLSGYRNAVSKKHSKVSRQIWQPLWPALPEKMVPLDFVTNGVHVPTWIDSKMLLLFDKYLGPQWLEDHDNPALWELVDDIPDEELWKTHYWLKIKLIDAIRERARKRWAEDRINSSLVLSGGTLLDHSVLTLGFARRFATYKRADLIFHNLERLKKLLNDPWRPIQLIFAGKAHPADDPAKRLLQKVFNAARNPDLGGHIAFVEDYGELMAQYMTHGVDVWLNNPLPPNEACGTSGMKAAFNGIPHLSIWDGWWIEGYNGKNGWAFGKKEIPGDRDEADAEAIYDLLENEIIPLYYAFSGDGIPHAWVKVMKEAIKSAGQKFSALRMVKEYISKFYANGLKKP
jgi:starch phosphorylase